MKDCIEFTLAELKVLFQTVPDPRLRCLDGCVAEVSISAEVLAAVRAGELCIIGDVVEPSEFGSAVFAEE